MVAEQVKAVETITELAEILKENDIDVCQAIEAGADWMFDNSIIVIDGNEDAGLRAGDIALEHGCEIWHVARLWKHSTKNKRINRDRWLWELEFKSP